MVDYTDFNDDDLILIKNKLFRKIYRAIVLTLILSTPLCLIAPYIPARRSGRRMIDSMEYVDAFLLFGIIWVLCLIVSYFWNIGKNNREYNNLFPYFRKDELEAEVLKIKKPFLMNYFKLILKIEYKIDEIEIDSELLNGVKIGDTIKVVVEQNSKTVLSLEIVTGSNITYPPAGLIS